MFVSCNPTDPFRLLPDGFFFFKNFVQNSILSELRFLFAGKSAKNVMAEGSLIAVDRHHNDAA
jgi:hypothetical protein